MTDISIIDYNAGNLFSIKSACEKVGLNAIITGNPEVIINSKAAILPGVGAFGEAMINLKSNQLDKVIIDFVNQEKPLLGICLGMQLLFDKSDEFGSSSGLGIIRGTVNKFDFKDSKLKNPIPHTGWNRIQANEKDWSNSILSMNNKNDFMYFVHSYYCIPEDKSNILSMTNYGGIDFCSAISYKNIFATQFHPEKSGEKGLYIYKEFKNLIN